MEKHYLFLVFGDQFDAHSQVKIRGRGAFNLIWCHTLSNFVYTHEK